MATAIELTKNGRTGGHQPERNSISDYVRCSRCTGLMVVEQGFDSILGSSEADVSIRRCVQCGEVVDPVILQNRRSQPESDMGRTRKGASRLGGHHGNIL